MKLSTIEFKKFTASFPRVCVDLLIEYQDKFLLTKRQVKPLKGKYYMPGGGILHGETIEQAALRIAKQETGLECVYCGVVGIYEGLFGDNEVDSGDHSVGPICWLKAETDKIILDFQHDGFKWVDSVILSASYLGYEYYKQHIIIDSFIMHGLLGVVE